MRQPRFRIPAVLLCCIIVFVLVLNYNYFSRKLAHLSSTKPLQHDAKITVQQNVVEQFKNMQMPKFLIVAADSHGLGLQQVFQRHLPHWRITVSSYPGGTVQNISADVVNIQKRLKQNVSYIIFHAGTNNFYYPSAIVKNTINSTSNILGQDFQPRDSNAVIIASILSALEALRLNFPGAAIIYSANLPRGDIPGYSPRQTEVNKKVQEKIAGMPRVYFVNHSPLFQAGPLQIHKTLYKGDHKHLNKDGQNILVRNLIRAMSDVGIKAPPKAWSHYK